MTESTEQLTPDVLAFNIIQEEIKKFDVDSELEISKFEFLKNAISLQKYLLGNLSKDKTKVWEIIFTPDWILQSTNAYICELKKELFLQRLGGIHSLDSLLYPESNHIIFVFSHRNGYPDPASGKPINISDIEVYQHECAMIFWWLVTLGLDRMLYKKYSYFVATVALRLGIASLALHDWCQAAVYWLKGNKISEDCDLELKTKMGRKFFLKK